MGPGIVGQNEVVWVEEVEVQWEEQNFSFRTIRAKVGMLAFLEGWRGIDNEPRDDTGVVHLGRLTVAWECLGPNRGLEVVGCLAG